MRRRDWEYWVTARTLPDLAARNAAWLHGTIGATPIHAGPPDMDLQPYALLLAAVNRTGYLADGVSRLADTGRCAVVTGLADDDTLAALRAALGFPPLMVVAQPVHPDIVEAYRAYCHPEAVQAVRAGWQVTVLEPDPGSAPLLWRALDQFAQAAPPVAWGVAS
jgi:hypothetical protein